MNIPLDDELLLLQHGYLLVKLPLAARCLKCGALTDDPDAHSSWHERHDS